MSSAPILVKDVAELIGAELIGDPAVLLKALGTIESAEAGDLSHLSSDSYRRYLSSTKAAAVILERKDLGACPTNALVVTNAKQAFAKASHLFVKIKPSRVGVVHSSAVISESAKLDETAYVGPNVVIGDDVEVGAGVEVHSNVVLGDRVKLSKDVVVMPNVSIYDDVKIGCRTIVHSNTVIGSDGFGFEPSEMGMSDAVAQLGGVDIGTDVSIGSCSCIDCGAIDDTIIGNGVKIDNQVQIGHNCVIGDNTIICGQVGIVGSTKVGANCILAGGSGIGGGMPIELCDEVVVSARATVTQSISKPGIYSGVAPFMGHKEWLRNSIRYKYLDRLFKRVKELEAK